MAQRKPGKAAGNGLKTFSIHSRDAAARPAMNALKSTRSQNRTFAFTESAGMHAADPETIARGYLEHALASDATPGFNAPVADSVPSEFKSLGTESIPLTGTTTVKFRQYFNKIPVYGSLVVVELDEANELLGINSSLGTPSGVDPVAKISAADAVAAVRESPDRAKNLDGIVPRLNFYFDSKTKKWRLVFILEDVPVVGDEKAKHRSPFLMDYVVDANSGKIVAEVPRTPTLVMRAKDGLGNMRSFEVEKKGSAAELFDPTLNVQTFDFKFKDPWAASQKLPGTAIKSPPTFSTAAVSAHANAESVSTYLRSILKRNNIDNKGGLMRSSINCVDASDSPDGKEWINAFWNGKQMVYGQRHDGAGFLSMSVALDVVGHEMFHGVTDMTSRLEYANQSGALNESYSDIFGVIIANHPNPDTTKWEWRVGLHLDTNGAPFRSMSKPSLYDQPEDMKHYVKSANTEHGDHGGVHTNSGIHNKAAYNILVAKKGGALVFKPDEVAAIFYIAVTQRLSRTSQFSDSRTAVIDSARTLFRNLPAADAAKKIAAIEAGFTAVGIK
jgi:Zn-dependent metalloprotease